MIKRDEFFWLNRISEATLLVGLEHGQFSTDFVKTALKGIADVQAQGDADPDARVTRYIDWEPMFLQVTGPAYSAMHVGRSSQDILSTLRTAIYRDGAIAVCQTLCDVIGQLLELARMHRDTILPSYTNGVAAQPTSLGHTLLAFSASLIRGLRALQNAISEYDTSAMGAMVLNGTSWPLDRKAMAERLGFDHFTLNAFDATCFTPVDFPLAVSAALAQIGIRTGCFITDVMVQYANARPWILLTEGGENTYVSSAMPQKRNPGLLNSAREQASDMVAEMMAVYTRAHNVASGMTDGKNVERNSRTLMTAQALLQKLEKILSGIVVNEKRAIEELNSDWTASQEVADRLMREHGVPFRIGHHFASSMVGLARKAGFTPLNFPYDEAVRLYREEIEKEFPKASPVFPMNEADLQSALDPREIVHARTTAGSANPTEVLKMHGQLSEELTRLRKDTDRRVDRINRALETLQRDVAALITQD